MRDVLVSVIVPIYNIENYLKQCVDSIIHQSYRNIEIVLVDDGSTDSSRYICDEYAKNDFRVKPIHKENGGLTSARKAGIEASTGEYVMFVDGDDWIDESTVECLVNEVKKNTDVELVFFPYTKEYSNKSVNREFFSNDKTFDNAEVVKQKIYRRLFGLTNSELSHPESLDYFATCWGKLYMRRLVLQAKFVDTKDVGSYEDGIFNIFALKTCNKAIYKNCPFYHYRGNNGSLSQSYRQHLAKQWEYLFSLIQLEINESYLSEDFQEALNNRIALSVLGIGMNELSNPKGSFHQFNCYMRDYISMDNYQEAIMSMQLKELPFAWKVMMFCCKNKLYFGLSFILQTINKLKSR